MLSYMCEDLEVTRLALAIDATTYDAVRVAELATANVPPDLRDLLDYANGPTSAIEYALAHLDRED
jgi:hypothetical protein